MKKTNCICVVVFKELNAVYVTSRQESLINEFENQKESTFGFETNRVLGNSKVQGLMNVGFVGETIIINSGLTKDEAKREKNLLLKSYEIVGVKVLNRYKR